VNISLHVIGPRRKPGRAGKPPKRRPWPPGQQPQRCIFVPFPYKVVRRVVFGCKRLSTEIDCHAEHDLGYDPKRRKWLIVVVVRQYNEFLGGVDEYWEYFESRASATRDFQRRLDNHANTLWSVVSRWPARSRRP